jgi:hypothetical protein
VGCATDDDDDDDDATDGDDDGVEAQIVTVQLSSQC